MLFRSEVKRELRVEVASSWFPLQTVQERAGIVSLVESSRNGLLCAEPVILPVARLESPMIRSH